MPRVTARAVEAVQKQLTVSNAELSRSAGYRCPDAWARVPRVVPSPHSTPPSLSQSLCAFPSWANHFRPSAREPVAGAARAIAHLDREVRVFLVEPEGVPLAFGTLRSHVDPAIRVPWRLHAVHRVTRNRMNVHGVAAHVPEIDAVIHAVAAQHAFARAEQEVASLRIHAVIGPDIRSARQRRGCRRRTAPGDCQAGHREPPPRSARLARQRERPGSGDPNPGDCGRPARRCDVPASGVA